MQGNNPNETNEISSKMLDPVVEKPRSMKPVAMCAVAFATVSMFAAVVTLPLVYNYVQTIQAIMSSEVTFCKVSQSYASFARMRQLFEDRKS